ncbi:uncharacterized protein CIMG_08832 [Coccidioides immitis RS]|uniref:Uncharacterized protein n=1 Tax=Coccidioides immitis (strain RS) TaxID=246410 RepID=J3K6A7_COCIM|nr:uncharacterized protein CIMG_08832 [Coccidioides immitis RS]EAS30086.3 hypothetical protein CIMG_08832 [Coccidioides immitis RS]
MGEQDTSEERKIFASCANRKPLSNGGGKLANPTVSGGRKHKWDEVLKQWSGKTAGDVLFGAKRNTGTTSSQTVTTARIAKVANSGARSNAFLVIN